MEDAYDTLQGASFRECKSEGCIGNKRLSYAPTPHTHLRTTETKWLSLCKGSNSL